MSASDSLDGRKLAGTKIVVCEGIKDCAFVEKLIAVNNLDDAGIDVWYPGHLKKGHGGFEAIDELLSGLILDEKWDDITSLLIVADADDKRTGRFQSLKDSLARIGIVVNSPYRFEGEKPKAAIYLMPEPSTDGCLENLLVSAVALSDPALLRCVDDFVTCVDKPGGWSANDRAKMQVQSLIAVCCRKKPGIHLGYVWDQDDNPIPAECDSYQLIVDLLKQL